MNLDHLRAELDAHANDVDAHARERMAGIRGKIAQRRRRKAGATVAASVLSVGAIIAAPVVSHLAAGPEPADGGQFSEKVDGDTKVAEAIGDEGDTKVAMTFTPEDTDFLLDINCDALAPSDDEGADLVAAPVLRVTVNDREVMPPCGQLDDVGSSKGLLGGVASSDDVSDFWSKGSVRAGEPVTVTLQVTQGPGQKARTKPIDGRIGVAAYEMTGERVETGGAALPEQKTVEGETYELGGYDVADGSKTTASVDVPALGSPAYVTYGATRIFLGSTRQVTVDGRGGSFSGDHGIHTEAMPDANEHALKIRDIAGEAPNSSVVLAYYVPAD